MLSSFTTAQYLLVLEPHEALAEEIIKLKQYFAETFDCPGAAKGKPSVTLARFEQYEMPEQRIVHRLDLIAKAQATFVVELHDFGSFPSHSIYLNVTTKTQVVQLVRSLRTLQPLLKPDKDHKPHFITEPSISIATKLLPWQYEKGWLEMSHTNFSGRFVAEHIVLLKKRQGETRYTVVKKCKLLNVKEEVVQGDLFG